MDPYQAGKPLTALIPKSGSRPSRLGLGTHALHRLLSGSARQGLQRLSYDLGVRHFDTAPSYGAGLAEREIGVFSAGHRSDLVLTTKFGIAPGRLASLLPGGAYLGSAAGAALRALRLRRPGPAASLRDYTPQAMRESVEGSLRRLRTDYIDVLYLHAPTLDSLGSPEPLIEALEALRRAGKVRQVGLSGPAPECEPIARSHPGLAEVLQVELAPDPQGLPAAPALAEAPAVGLWEFPGAPGGAPLQVFERLQRIVRGGIVLLSTPSRHVLRQAAGFFAP